MLTHQKSSRDRTTAPRNVLTGFKRSLARSVTLPELIRWLLCCYMKSQTSDIIIPGSWLHHVRVMLRLLRFTYHKERFLSLPLRPRRLDFLLTEHYTSQAPAGRRDSRLLVSMQCFQSMGLLKYFSCQPMMMLFKALSLTRT